MAYQFNKDKTAKFKFHPYQGTSTEFITLEGINASLPSADIICDGVSSLMAIGSNTPVFYNAVRTATEMVEETD